MEPDEPGHARAPRRAGPGYRLVLLRHGESEWNTRNRFTGWVNVSLTPDGEDQATRAGEMLAAADVRPDVVHTSLQRRAIRSADLALAACDQEWIAVRRSWRINGRHYGVLQGKDSLRYSTVPGRNGSASGAVRTRAARRPLLSRPSTRSLPTRGTRRCRRRPARAASPCGT